MLFIALERVLCKTLPKSVLVSCLVSSENNDFEQYIEAFPKGAEAFPLATCAEANARKVGGAKPSCSISISPLLNCDERLQIVRRLVVIVAEDACSNWIVFANVRRKSAAMK